MSLVDRYGRPIAAERVRRALGFVDRWVKADDSDTITGCTPGGAKNPEPGWYGDAPFTQPNWMKREGE